MSVDQARNAFDLLGQAEKSAAPVRLHTGVAPQLEVAWGGFHQSLRSSLSVLIGTSAAPEKFRTAKFFKDCWVERRIPRRAMIAAGLWHFAFLIMPFPQIPAAARKFSAFENTQITWSGPINDLPLLNIRLEKPQQRARRDFEKPLPREAPAAFHPRQRIFTDPVRPTHPRQTLINPAAHAEPPKLLPNLPNIVQLQTLPGPSRPRLQISEQALAKLRPRQRRTATVTSAPLPDVPALDQKPAELTLSASANAPARPKLELKTGAVPRVAQRAQPGEVVPAPEVGAGQGNVAATFIALSATPAPPVSNIQAPQGNLAARISISPEGKQPGVPGGTPVGGSESKSAEGSGSNGKNPIAVSISGGNPPANNGVASLGDSSPHVSSPSPRLLTATPDSHTALDDPPVRTGPPNFGALPPGAQPENIFASQKVYKLVINMPNLNSATGSWILNFSELRTNPDEPRRISAGLGGPAPLKKVDPKYPPTLINERVEGEVVLYAVIRRDGSVDSIQLVHGIDEQLDANAMDALSQWKFRPAHRQGSPVELEAIVHIPFHIPSLQ